MNIPHMNTATLIAAIMGYGLGAIPFGLLLTRMAGLEDIRSIGSGNIGATNVLRTGRKGLAAATLLLDGLKAVLAVLIARFCLGEATAPLAAVAAVVGHIFPVWLGLRGGKGVASGLGAMLALAWPVGVAACVVWLVVAKLTRISSAGALAAFAVMPVLGLALDPIWHTQESVLASVPITLLIVLRHRDNIRRLLAGQEPRIGQKTSDHDTKSPQG